MGVLRPPILPLSILQDVQNRKPLDHQENCPEEHDVCYSPNIGSEVYKIIQMLSTTRVGRDVNGERGGLDVDRIFAVFVRCVNHPLESCCIYVRMGMGSREDVAAPLGSVRYRLLDSVLDLLLSALYHQI